MTAKEKFEARLKELALLDEWNRIGGFGRVAMFDDEGGIVLLIHEDTTDGFSEIWYPPYNELRESEKFRTECGKDFVSFDHDDPEFAAKVARWLLKLTDECPLEPVDVYWPGNGLHERYANFEDDKEPETDDEEEAAYQAHIERMEKFSSWMDTTLAYMRGVLYEAVRIELARGHNLYDNFRIEGDFSHFADFYMDYVTEEKVTLGDDGEHLYIECIADAETFCIPFYLLTENEILNVYNSMK